MEYIFKTIKQKSTTFLSCSSLKSNKEIFIKYFPGQNLGNDVIHYEF